MEKTNKIDGELQKVASNLGMTLNSISRLATIEYLRNHFGIDVSKTEEKTILENKELMAQIKASENNQNLKEFKY